MIPSGRSVQAEDLLPVAGLDRDLETSRKSPSPRWAVVRENKYCRSVILTTEIVVKQSISVFLYDS